MIPNVPDIPTGRLGASAVREIEREFVTAGLQPKAAHELCRNVASDFAALPPSPDGQLSDEMRREILRLVDEQLEIISKRQNASTHLNRMEHDADRQLVETLFAQDRRRLIALATCAAHTDAKSTSEYIERRIRDFVRYYFSFDLSPHDNRYRHLIAAIQDIVIRFLDTILSDIAHSDNLLNKDYENILCHTIESQVFAVLDRNLVPETRSRALIINFARDIIIYVFGIDRSLLEKKLSPVFDSYNMSRESRELLLAVFETEISKQMNPEDLSQNLDHMTWIEKAPEEWPGADGEDPVSFIKRVYSDHVEAKSLALKDIRRVDPLLYKALANWRRRHADPPGFHLLTQREVTDAWVARVREGKEPLGDLKAAYRFQGATKRRGG